MSGHSKWATTKHRKGAQDAKRSALFSKLSRNITVAARLGNDPNPDNNASLAAAVAKAKAQSMPKDKIKSAIDKAFGAGAEGLVDGGLNLVLGHGLGLGLGHGGGQGGVVVRVGVVAQAGRDGDVTAQLGEQGGTLCVLRTLAVLGCCPFRVSGHVMLLLFPCPLHASAPPAHREPM